MPHSPRLDNLSIRETWWHRTSWRAWREWCFARSVARRLLWRALVLALVLAAGGALFRRYADRADLSFVEAVYDTFSLVFAQPPGPFPRAAVLRVMYFAVPIIGLTVIIESLVNMGLMIRDRRQSERGWCRTMAHSLTDHIVLVGMGKLGFRTFKLLRRLGQGVVVIECNAQCQFLEEVRRDGSPLLIGDSRDERFLEDANIGRAKAIVLATNDDLTNLEIALDARRLAPRIRVVLRMFDQNMADKVAQGFNIHMAMSQSAISAPTFATAAIEPSIVAGTVISDELLVMHRWRLRAGGPLSGRTVAQATTEHRIGVVERRGPDGATALFPPPDTRLDPGDVVVVQGTYQTLMNLREQAAEPGWRHEQRAQT